MPKLAEVTSTRLSVRNLRKRREELGSSAEKDGLRSFGFGFGRVWFGIWDFVVEDEDWSQENRLRYRAHSVGQASEWHAPSMSA